MTMDKLKRHPMFIETTTGFPATTASTETKGNQLENFAVYDNLVISHGRASSKGGVVVRDGMGQQPCVGSFHLKAISLSCQEKYPPFDSAATP